MKKIYIQPQMRVANSNATTIIATSGGFKLTRIAGDGYETHYGGNNMYNPLHAEGGYVGATDDDDLVMYSKNRFYN